MKFKANIYESALAAITLLSIIGLCFYFYELVSPSLTQDNPFKIFDSNSGIIKISIASLISRTVFVSCFAILYIGKSEPSRKVLIVYLLAALIISFLQWFELYYGSMFYYGEVRDKQGLTFPVLASAMLTLVVWKINYQGVNRRGAIVKMILAVLLNAGLCLLWMQVSEPWNLWQS